MSRDVHGQCYLPTRGRVSLTGDQLQADGAMMKPDLRPMLATAEALAQGQSQQNQIMLEGDSGLA